MHSPRFIVLEVYWAMLDNFIRLVGHNDSLVVPEPIRKIIKKALNRSQTILLSVDFVITVCLPLQVSRPSQSLTLVCSSLLQCYCRLPIPVSPIAGLVRSTPIGGRSVLASSVLSVVDWLPPHLFSPNKLGSERRKG